MIFVVVPVHNRVDHLAQFVNDLSVQTGAPEFELIVVDAGSTDGTQKFICDPTSESAERPFPVTYVEGTSDWWWSAAVAAGLDRIRDRLASRDSVLIINDDVRIASDYIARIAGLSEQNPRSLITSCLCDVNDPSAEPFHYGVVVDATRLEFHDLEPSQIGDPESLLRSDVASGRGTLFPADAILGGVQPRVRELPHYLADYDMGSQAGVAATRLSVAATFA